MKRSKHSFLIRQTDRQLDPVVRALDVKQQSQYRKRLVEGRQETTVLNSQCSNANDLRTLRQVEQAIFEAQDRCVVFAEGIEVECQKEKFFDQEIRLLQDKLSSLRARKELTSKKLSPVRIEMSPDGSSRMTSATDSSAPARRSRAIWIAAARLAAATTDSTPPSSWL